MKKSKSESLPSKRPREELPTQLFISGLPTEKTEKYLARLLKKHAYEATQFPGSALITVQDKRSVKKILKLSQTTYKSNTLLVNKVEELHSVTKKYEAGPKTIFVGNLALGTTKEQLASFFSGCGKTKSIRLQTDETGQLKGFGHVEFFNVHGVATARQLEGRKLNGKQIKIDVARERTKK